jgi:hypothetical protein
MSKSTYNFDITLRLFKKLQSHGFKIKSVQDDTMDYPNDDNMTYSDDLNVMAEAASAVDEAYVVVVDKVTKLNSRIFLLYGYRPEEFVSDWTYQEYNSDFNDRLDQALTEFFKEEKGNG